MFSELDGIILDATALIDFQFLGDWDWLKNNYAPLYIAQEVLDSDNLTPQTRSIAEKYLMPICLDTEEMFNSFMRFALEAPLLSIADRSTLALAQHRFLLCASDDGLMVKTCENHGIPYIRTLKLLSEMVRTKYKTVAQVKKYVQILMGQRGKHISQSVLRAWYDDLERSQSLAVYKLIIQ
ncbi:MAG: hypothetical protein HC799_19965 [Limnothrix sp. RL_2_0]|nr:hypothetical protein [Limnothrix sp. RL_2_0]